MQTERELNISQLFREFRDWRDNRSDDIETFLVELKAHSNRYANLIAPSAQDRKAVLARRLKSLDTNTVYPTLLFLVSLPAETLVQTDLYRIVVDLEFFLVRRFVCGLTTKNYNKFFLSLLVKAKRAAAEGVSIADAVRDELLRSPEDLARLAH